MGKIKENDIFVLIEMKNFVPICNTLTTRVLPDNIDIKGIGLKKGDEIVIKIHKNFGYLCEVKHIKTVARTIGIITFYPTEYVIINKEIDYGSHTRCKIKEFIFSESDNEKEQILMSIIKEKIRIIIQYRKDELDNDIIFSINSSNSIVRLSEIILEFLNIDNDKKIEILFEKNILKKGNLLLKEIEKVLVILKTKESINKKLQKNITENQKKYYLNEQLKIIKNELGLSSDIINEYKEFQKKIEKAKMPDEVKEKAYYELNKLNKMNVMSPEANVVRNYLDWLVSIPWYKKTKNNLDIKLAEKILDKNHFGLKKIKERVLEYLSVIKLSKSVKGQILCFVGPPGVGKTSLGKSIAESMGRSFVRISLGGVKDEAEIRGHRKTYVGALPGKIVQMMRRAGVKNPVFMLDEVDKLGSDFKGDPSSALLEVLDPELNNAFMDHYLEIEYDLSNVLFICTANVIHTIPPALRDRMEIINLPGYLEFEKFEICKRYLVPKTLKSSGLKKTNVKIEDKAIKYLIKNYTRESGVRNLEKQTSKIMRKIAREIAENSKKKKFIITEKNIQKYLGSVSISNIKDKKSLIGVAKGLAWTQYGGDILSVEALIFPGKGRIQLTGKLGDVLKESANASISYLRKYAKKYDIEEDFYNKYDIHIHLPEGAIPKDGPSAGITITMALFSALKKVPLNNNFAMTGEITLRGIILPIGGLAEKIVAAQSVGIENVIIPYQNKPQYNELPKEAKRDIKIHFVKTIDEVIKILFN